MQRAKSTHWDPQPFRLLDTPPIQRHKELRQSTVACSCQVACPASCGDWQLNSDLDAQVVEVVAEQCGAHRVSTLVVDPVLVSTSGHSLGDSEVASALKDRSADPLYRFTMPSCPVHMSCGLSLSM